jgi:hypothetical protein
MKYNLKKLIIAGLIPVIAALSCGKKLDDAYANPNATVRVPVETILPSLIGNILGSSAAAGSAYGIGNDAILIGRYIQYWGTNTVSNSANSGTQYDRMGGATDGSDNFGSVWAAHYFGMGQNLNRMVEWGLEEDKWDFVGAGWALRAWSLFEAANEYNNLPLRQAFNTSLQTFNYENQPEIYDSVRVYCHRALEFLNRSGGGMNPQTFASADYYFNGGDLNKWKKFVYGILARSYAYLNNKPEYKADSVIKYTDLSVATNADNITCKFANTGITGTSSYFGPLRGNVGAIRQSAFIANLMSGQNPDAFTGVFDPRAYYLLRENTNGTFKGIIPGQTATNSGIPSVADQPANFWGNPFSSTTSPATIQGRYIFRNEAEFPIMTASEILFLKAEALLKKSDKPGALTAYTAAITLNFDMLTSKYSVSIPAGKEITDQSKADYLNNPAIVPATAAELTLTHIMLQKYIALYGWGVQETWVDMRRYHYIDKDPETSKQVYAGFTPPLTNLFENNAGELVYRARPRYNSEYLYNIPALESVGALDLNYHTKKTWFALP